MENLTSVRMRFTCRRPLAARPWCWLGLIMLARPVLSLAGPNLIRNPGFEEGPRPDCQYVGKYWESPNGCLPSLQQLTTGAKHSGSWSQFLGSSTATDQGLVRQVTDYNSIQEGKTYIISAWIKSTVTDEWGWNVFRLDVYSNDTTLFHINMPRQATPYYDWREIRWEQTVPTGLGINRVGVVLTRHWHNGQVWYDDISVSEKETGPAQIGVSPASFTRTLVLGAPLPVDVLQVQNVGSDPLTYTVTPSVNWLKVDPTSGTSVGEADSIDLMYIRPNLVIGTQQGLITVAGNASNSPRVVPITVTTTVSPDQDRDVDVDQEDFARLQICLTGDGIFQGDPNCQSARLDGDNDVDQDDVAIFLACYGGPKIPPSAGCVP